MSLASVAEEIREVGHVCPDEGTAPTGVVSLLEMLRFYAISFAVTHGNLERAESLITMEAMRRTGDGPIPPDSLSQIQQSLLDMGKGLEELPVSRSLKEQLERLTQRVQDDKLCDETAQVIGLTLIQEIKRNIMDELASHLYLMVPVARRNLYVQPEPVFGLEVHNKFGDAQRDVADAARCLALDQWTAAVFHLMRVLEHGLRDLASRTGAIFPISTELEQWKTIIDVIEATIRKFEQQPKSPQKTKQLEFYGKAASQFWYFKEAWRNHVAHSRATYDEREALHVFNSVHEFMRALARNP